MAVSYSDSIGLVDSHCHLNLLKNKTNRDIKEIIDYSRAQGVKILQTVCTHFQELKEIIEITEWFEEVFCSVGLHPCNVLEYIESYNNLEEALKNLDQNLLSYVSHAKVIGLGETGLDYYHEYSEQLRNAQIKAFERHIGVSQVTGLPLIIHTRDAEEDTATVLNNLYKQQKFTGVMHCFTGSRKLAQQALDLGLYISASGIVTFKNALEIQDLFRYIPIDKLLIETDSPYLAPIPHRGEINEPAFVQYVAKTIAEIKEMNYQDIVAATYNNFCALFNKISILSSHL